MIEISSRALVLHEIIRGIDHDIEARRKAGLDTFALEAERKCCANECMVYLNAATLMSSGKRRKRDDLHAMQDESR